MKKFAFMMVCMMAMLFVSNNASAQDKKNPFIGSWAAIASTPMGDSEMTIVFERRTTRSLSPSTQLWRV